MVPESVFSKNGKTRPISLGSGFKANFAHLVAASLTINLLSLAMPLMMLQAYDRILPHHGYGTLTLLIIGVGCALLLEIILRIGRAYLTGWAGAVFEHQTSCRALRHLLDAGMQGIESQGSGVYLQKMSSIGRLRGFYSGQALITLIDLPFVFIYLGLIAYIAEYLVFIPLALLAAFCVIAWMMGPRLKKDVREQDFSNKIRYNFIIETLSGVHSIKALGLERFFLRRNERLQNRTSMSHFRVALNNHIAANCGIFFSRIMTVAVVAAGAVKVIHGQMGTGGLAACILLTGRIMQPVQRTLGLWTRFQSFFVDKQELAGIFSLPARPRAKGSPQIGSGGALELSHMTFRYGSNGGALLKDISLKLSSGQSVALAGPAGGGKTTLLYLMAGLFSPLEGEIRVDSMPPDQIPAAALGKHIGYLAEKGEIFSGTIRENLTFFETIPEEDAMIAAKKLGIDRAVALLPAGYETRLTDRVTDPVPPGIKQQIAIARVLAAKPRIILFNNADRGLDINGYNHLFRLLGKLKSRIAMVMISDDRNILRLADREFYLADGRLTETAPADSKKHSVLPFRELRV